MIVHPCDLTVLADDAVLDLIVLAGLVRAVRLGHHPLAVVGVDHAHPHPRIGEALGGRVSGEALVLRAHVPRGRDLVHRIDVDDRWKLLHETTDTLLGHGECLFGLHPLGDILDEPLPHGGGIASIDDHRRVVHPDDRSVLSDEAVLGVEGLARAVGTSRLCDHGYAIVLVDA